MSVKDLDIPFQGHQQPGALCTWTECAAGHRWTLELAVVKCPGCQAQVVAMRMVQCPVCNEPAVRHVVRCDYCATAKWIGAECKGQKGKSEVMVSEMVRDLGQLELDLGEGVVVV